MVNVRMTQARFAAAVGISQQSVSDLVRKGVLAEGDAPDAWLLAYCSRLRGMAAARHPEGPLDLAQERSALARVQRIGVELRNAVLRSEFAPTAMLTRVLADTSKAVAEHIDHLPARIKTACPALPDAALSVVLTTIDTARNEWVKQTAELVPPLQADEDGEADVGSAA